MDLQSIVRELRAGGGDTTSVEVKRARGGLPDSLTPTLSALANLPGGGLVILGLDEEAGFHPAGLEEPHRLRQGLASKARSYQPPVRLVFEEGAEVEGQPVVVATVLECDPSAKPCRVSSTGRAFVRGYDGDYELSDTEIQAFLSQRSQPLFDRQPVSGAKRDDLDDGLVRSWMQTARSLAPYGVGRFDDDDEMLVRAGVMSRSGEPTKAGLLSLGRHPQEWFPRYVIQAAVEPTGGVARHRAQDAVTISGAIPRMLAGALDWARRNFERSTIESDEGMVLERHTYPLAAFRELISNALVHRDLDAWSEGRAVEVRYSAQRLIVSSPGGLWGITTDRLGLEGVSSARNAQLLSICQYVRTDDGEGRVVEALAQGLPRVHRLLADMGARPPRYVDRGISFTVILGSSIARRNSGAVSTQASDLPLTQAAVFKELDHRWVSVADISAMTGLRAPNARRALRALRARDLIEVDGGRGRPTSYRRKAE